MSEWKEYKFSDFVTINPTVSLRGDIEYSFVEMKDLEDGNKFCFPSSVRKPKSGARFDNGDTLFAKITPCLENGKICQVRGLKDGKGFGSTEFLVFRGKERVSDTDFIFYLSRWDEVRSFAESNFEGTSGRQRVPRNCFDNLYLELPQLKEQRTISEILSSLDDKIDLLHRQNKTLEQMAETLFRKWFVEDADESWESGTIKDYASHLKIYIHPQKNANNIFYHYSIPAFDEGKEPVKEFGKEIKSNKYKVVENSIMFSKLNPHTDKRIWLIPKEIEDNSISSTEFQIVKPLKAKYLFFIYGWLSLNENYNEIASGVGGTSGSHQRIDPHTIFDFPCPRIPETYIEDFDTKVEALFLKQNSNTKQIQSLTKLRDTLLSKLMSGEVRVKM